MNRLFFSIFISFTIIFNYSFSQDQSKLIENSVSNLKQKLILTDDQVTSITRILDKFFTEKTNNKVDTLLLIKQTNDKIESFLDRKQLIKFDIIKVEWWSRLLDSSTVK